MFGQFSHSVMSESCNPMHCSMPGFPVHHQLPEFTPTHVHSVSDAIQPSHPLSSPSPPAFNLSQHLGLRIYLCMRAHLVEKSCLTLLWPPWTVAHQASLSMGFPRQEYWSELPFTSPGDLPNPGIKLASLYCRQNLYHQVIRDAQVCVCVCVCKASLYALLSYLFYFSFLKMQSTEITQ